MRHPKHPNPVAGAALYYAENCNVVMKDADDGSLVVIAVKRNPDMAARAAMMWQKRENTAVTKAAKQAAKQAAA